MPDPIKISADITFNTKDAEKQLSSLGDTVSKSVSTSKQVREMADSFNRISTRDMSKNMTKLVDKIRDGIQESKRYESRISGLADETERLKSVARAGNFNPISNDAMEMSDAYKKLIHDVQYYQDEIKKTQDLLTRGTKTVASGTSGLKWGEQPTVTTRALNSSEIAEAEKYLTSLQGKVQDVETEMQNLEQRGDAFPKITQSTEMLVVAMNKVSARVIELMTSFTNMQSSAPQSMSATASSLNGVYDAMSKLGEVNIAQPIQAQASSVEQSMQRVTDATTEGMQQVQTQVQNVQQAVSRPVTTQIIDTTALQRQMAIVSSQISMMTASVTSQTTALIDTVRGGFQGISSQVSAEMQNTVTQLSARVAQLEAEVSRAQASMRNVGAGATRSSKVAVVAFGSIGKAINGAFNSVHKLISAVGTKLSSAFHTVQKSVDKAFSSRTLKRGLTTILKYGFGVRSLYFAFRKLRTAVKEGLENLVKYEKAVGTSKELNSTNQAITNLRTSLLYLKNAWASAFAPIITAVMPMLTTLIDGIAQTGNYIAKFIGALTGQKTVLNAVKVSAGDYADSLDNASKSAGGASKATKKLTDRLAAFDDLNILGKDNDNGGAGGGAGSLLDNLPDPSEMFKYVEAESNFADMLKEAWGSGDFSGIGSMLKDKIVEALEGIDWDDVKSKVSKFMNGVGSFLEGLFGDPELYTSLGKAIGEAFNTFNIGIEELLKKTKNIKFGENLGKGINEFLRTTDFEVAGKNINELITQITDNIKGFAQTVNSDEVVKAIEDFINGLDIGDIIAKVQDCTLEVAKLVIKVVGQLIIDAGEALGDKWYKEASEGLETTVDGQTIVLSPNIQPSDDSLMSFVDLCYTKLGKLFVDNAVKMSIPFTGATEEETYDAIFSAMDKVTGFFESAKETFDETWGNDFKAGLEAIGEACVTVYENVSLLVEVFKLGFEEAGEGVVTFMVDLVDWFEKVGQEWTEFWALFEGFDIEDFLEGLSESVAVFIGWIVDGFTQLGTTLSDKWEEIKNGASEKWAELKSNISTKVQEIKDKVTQKITELKDKLSETWQNIKDNAYEKFVLMRVAIVEIFTKLKDALKTPINGILSIVEFLINKIINGINSIVDKLNSLPDLKFTNPFTGADYKLGFNLPKLSTVSIPRLAEGAVIPPNKEFMAVLGDQSNGTNVEAPLDTIKQAVAEVLANNGNDQVVQLLQTLITVVENKNLTIGDKEIGKANARYVNQQRLIRGTNF